jgi:alkylated DNA repair dioxygenase AlkB
MRVFALRSDRSLRTTCTCPSRIYACNVNEIPFQPELFAVSVPSFDGAYRGIRRIALDDASWVDHLEGWVQGADALFQTILRTRRWKQRSRWMYQRRVKEPRLTAPWSTSSGEPLEPPLIEAMRQSLSERYGVCFDSVGFNLYRNGRDSVAWHRDHIVKEIDRPIIALVSLGEPRKWLLRPRGGGTSRTFTFGRGDLLVTGGRTNRDWEHSVPKVAEAGPRISLAFRYGLDPRAYAGKTESEPSSS